MQYRVLSSVLALVIMLGAVGVLPVAAQDGTVTFHSQPDSVALYQGDMAYVRDVISIPAGMAARIVLPASALRDSLVMTTGETRLRSYRLTTPEAGGPLAVQIDAAAGNEARELTLAYLVSGLGWRPLYDMDVMGTDRVQFGFDAELHNTVFDLVDVDVRLVAGMPGADSSRQPQMTVTQMNTLYAEPVAAGAMTGAVAINHVYPIGTQTLRRGETLRWSLFYDELDARRLLVWDARFGQRTDVIYKVTNESDVPFVAGAVYAYEDGLYVGQDAIEWTPSGGEGNVTIGGLSTIRVRRTESVEEIGTFANDRYRHTVVLAITNHGGEDIDLQVLDEWNRAGQDFTFSEEPARQGNNVLRWELAIPAGEQVEITYTYIVD
jgi:hypothetical protein